MTTVPKLPGSSLSTANSYTPSKTDVRGVPTQFPAGLRVLVVDDDTTCLKILEQMLRKCSYEVTPCTRATIALSLLREKKDGFDVVISDVHMPDMDGFKLLEHVGLEMDLPVIMMSADGRTSAVMRGVKHGACDYLIKPVRIEELKNIWQHVVRKKWIDNKEIENSGSVEDNERHIKRNGSDEAEYTSSVNEATDCCSWKPPKKRRESKEDEDDGELDNDDPSATKKPRVVWSVELHQQFVSAVNQLGIDKAVPKRILELMNVPGLTRENVASHLQKFRLYLKRLSGVAQNQGIPSSFVGSVEPNSKITSLCGFDFQALAASGQIPPQTLAALHAEMLGRPTSSLTFSGTDPSVLLQASLQGSKSIPVDRAVAFGPTLTKCPSSITKLFPQSVEVEDISSGFTTWPPGSLSTIASSSNVMDLNSPNNKMLVQMLQQQQQSTPQESNNAINVQPSCLIVPSHASTVFSLGNNAGPIDQNSTYSNGVITDYGLITQSNALAFGIGQIVDGDLKNLGALSGYSMSGASDSANPENTIDWRVPASSLNASPANTRSISTPDLSEVPVSYGKKIGGVTTQGSARNLGFVGKEVGIPSRFAVNDFASLMGDQTSGRISMNGDGRRAVKEELNLDVMESKVGMPGKQHFSPSDLMSVLSK